MAMICLRSLGLHLVWFLRSFCPGCHPDAPLTGRRLRFLLVFPLFVALQIVHWLGFLADELFFSGYRRVRVRRPVFITGIPRSGTTFIHRILAADTERYATVAAWEALLAPSITERKLLLGLKSADRRIGRPLARAVHHCLRRSTGNFDAVHETRPSSPEEDYLFLLPAGGCFLLALAFPFSRRLWQTARLDEASPRRRAALLGFYHRCLQKHLYHHGPTRILLSKNAAFASWAPFLRQLYPDAVFLLCVREPRAALSSQLSSLAPAREGFGTDPEGRVTASRFTDLFAHQYATLGAFAENNTVTSVVIHQEDLARDPAGFLRAALRQVGIRITPPLENAITALGDNPHRSAHRHDPGEAPLDEARIRNCLEPAYKHILRFATPLDGTRPNQT